MRLSLLSTLRETLRVLNIEPRGIRHPWDGDQYKARSEARIAVMEAIAALEKDHQLFKSGYVVSTVAGERSNVRLVRAVSAQAEVPCCSCGRKGPHACSTTSDLDEVSRG
jgi:hypothetical protein